MAGPRIGLALGGGGARGLCHVHILETLDEMGLKPAAIAGTSIGSIFGAAFASGMSGAEIRDFVLSSLGRPADVWSKLWKSRPGTFSGLFSSGLVQLDPDICLEVFLPKSMPADFAALTIPFHAIAADFYACREVVLSSGPLRKAIAASIALPIVFKPVEIDGNVLIDGGVVNPLPFDRMPAEVDVTVAIDVIGMPVRSNKRDYPNAKESIYGASQIVMHSVVTEKLRSHAPDILIRPPVDHVRVLDFLKARQILEETAVIREELKFLVDQRLKAIGLG